MKPSAIRNRVAALVLGTALVTPGAWAAESRTERILERAAATPKVLVLRLWEQLTALWGENGSFIDPNGGRAPSPAPDSGAGGPGEAGPIIDLKS